MKKRKESEHTKEDFEHLCEALVSIASSHDMEALLIDLCTPAEIESLSDRLKVAKLLNKDASYRDIADQTGVSVTTVTRVARCLNGDIGGYRKIIK